jgi:hypothetical protein
MSAIARWFERRRIERELAIEMNGHIEEMAEDMIEAGQSPEQALQNARRKFGNVPLQMERSRDAWGGRRSRSSSRIFGSGIGFS